MQFPNYYMSKVDKLDALQRWILVHSRVYYDYDENIVLDKMFDDNAKQLYKMQSKRPDLVEESRWGYAFEEFNGSTGMGLYEMLSEEHKQLIDRDAKWIIVCSKKKGGGFSGYRSP